MSIEQIARDTIMNFPNSAKLKGMFSPDAKVSGGPLPQPIPALEAIKALGWLPNAFPDVTFSVQQVTVNGNEATVRGQWSGTQTAVLSLPIPGMQPIPPTGKKVVVKDGWVVSVQGDKVAQIRIDSPADGGVPSLLAQLGVKMPGM